MAARGRGRPRIEFEQYKGIIFNLYIVDRQSLDDVRSLRSYKRQIAKWGFNEKRKTLVDSVDLVQEVERLWHKNMKSSEMLYILQQDPRFTNITLSTLKSLRLKHRFLFRNYTGADQEVALQTAHDVVLQHLKSGQSARYGISYAHTIARMTAKCFISREQIAEMNRRLDPIGVAARTARAHRQRSRYRVKGPNQVWSIDGHDKLTRFGIEIYGMIDGYSRFVLDCYVGIGTRTAVGGMKYFLRAVREHGFPKRVRSDKGGETDLIAECQVTFRRDQKPDLPFYKAYIFGPSTANQRIESWWNLLTTGQTEQWRKLFERLEQEGLFDGSDDYDQIAIRFIYMPVIREHVYTFVQVHNTHRIRRQKNREEYLPTGKPYMMYAYPPLGVRNYATPANDALLDYFDSQVENYSIEDFQTPQVEAFCTEFLADNGFPSVFSFDPCDDCGDESVHVKAYKRLRQGLRAFEYNGGHLERLEKPLGAREWIMAQEIFKEQEKIEKEGQRDGILVSEVETDDGDSGSEDANNDVGEDDGFFLNINTSLNVELT